MKPYLHTQPKYTNTYRMKINRANTKSMIKFRVPTTYINKSELRFIQPEV